MPTGKGVLNLKEWTDAVKATGYRGWWAAETFSRNMQQQSVNVVARDMRQLLGTLVGPVGPVHACRPLFCRAEYAADRATDAVADITGAW